MGNLATLNTNKMAAEAGRSVYRLVVDEETKKTHGDAGVFADGNHQGQ